MDVDRNDRAPCGALLRRAAQANSKTLASFRYRLAPRWRLTYQSARGLLPVAIRTRRRTKRD